MKGGNGVRQRRTELRLGEPRVLTRERERSERYGEQNVSPRKNSRGAAELRRMFAKF